MNTGFQNRQLTSPSTASSLDDQSASLASHAAPLSAQEIESLLRSARRSFNQPASLQPLEELGPGDVQHLRGNSTIESGTLMDATSVPQPLEALQVFETQSRQAERRVTQAIPESRLEQREEFPAGLNPPAQPDPVPSPPKSDGGLTLEDLGDVDLDISIELGRTELLIEEILKLREGSVVALDRLAGDPVDIVANGRLVARGELLIVEGKFGVRLSEVL